MKLSEEVRLGCVGDKRHEWADRIAELEAELAAANNGLSIAITAKRDAEDLERRTRIELAEAKALIQTMHDMDAKGVEFGKSVLATAQERDALQEAAERSLARGRQNHDTYITQPLKKALKEVEG